MLLLVYNAVASFVLIFCRLLFSIASIIIMSDAGQSSSRLEWFKSFNGKDEKFLEQMRLKQYQGALACATQQLVCIYALDQNIGGAIFDALCNVVSAANDNAENFDESIANLKSSQAVLTVSGDEPDVDDQLVGAFKQEIMSTVDSISSMFETKFKVARRIVDAFLRVVNRTEASSNNSKAIGSVFDRVNRADAITIDKVRGAEDLE